MRAAVQRLRMCGMEVYAVVVNGTVLHTYMSEPSAKQRVIDINKRLDTFQTVKNVVINRNIMRKVQNG